MVVVMTAANDLGLSDAVPGWIIVHTGARLRPIKLGKQTTAFRLTAPSKLFWAGRPAMRVVRAGAPLAARRTDGSGRPSSHPGRLRAIFADPDQGRAIVADLTDGLPALPAWMQDLLRPLLVARWAAMNLRTGRAAGLADCRTAGASGFGSWRLKRPRAGHAAFRSALACPRTFRSAGGFKEGRVPALHEA
jgi:hypothetical protein